MKAVVYEGPRQVRVEDVADPVILEPTDVLVRIIITNICGSDLHMYEGRTAMDSGRVPGAAGRNPAHRTVPNAVGS